MARKSVRRADAREQEPLQVATLPVLWTAAGLLALVIGSLAIMLLVFWSRTGTLPSDPTPSPIAFPDPKLQIHQSEELARIMQRDDERLHAGAALPIEQAMQRIAGRGSAAYGPLASPAAGKKTP